MVTNIESSRIFIILRILFQPILIHIFYKILADCHNFSTKQHNYIYLK